MQYGTSDASFCETELCVTDDATHVSFSHRKVTGCRHFVSVSKKVALWSFGAFRSFNCANWSFQQPICSFVR